MKNNILHWSKVDLRKLVNSIRNHLNESFNFKGPFFLYNESIIKERVKKISQELSQCQINFSVKSLSNLSILKIISSEPHWGADIVSAGELERALRANFKPNKIVFAGVGKTKSEISTALKVGIHTFHIESIQEVYQIQDLAKEAGIIARVCPRLNPNINPGVHNYITTGKKEDKFGLSESEWKEFLASIKDQDHLNWIGLQAHIGSQIMTTQPFIDTIDFLISKANQARMLGFPISEISFGGGFGVDYQSFDKPISEFNLSAINNYLNKLNLDYSFFIEPGRFLTAYTGVLIAQIQYLKKKANYDIAITDAGISELIRPALYQAYHPLKPIIQNQETYHYDIAGPICESSDFFVKQAQLPKLSKGDDLAILHAGAYGSVMASNYNTRLLVPEILFNQEGFKVIRKPQTIEQLLENEEVDSKEIVT